MGAPGILDTLSRIAPLTAIRGNIDTADWARKLPGTEAVELGGLFIYVLHNLRDLELKPEAAGFQVVISGHSHAPKQELRNRVLYFNPGSAGPQRFKLPVSIGRLTIESGKVSGEIIPIEVKRSKSDP